MNDKIEENLKVVSYWKGLGNFLLATFAVVMTIIFAKHFTVTPEMSSKLAVIPFLVLSLSVYLSIFMGDSLTKLKYNYTFKGYEITLMYLIAVTSHMFLLGFDYTWLLVSLLWLLLFIIEVLGYKKFNK